MGGAEECMREVGGQRSAEEDEGNADERRSGHGREEEREKGGLLEVQQGSFGVRRTVSRTTILP